MSLTFEFLGSLLLSFLHGFVLLLAACCYFLVNFESRSAICSCNSIILWSFSWSTLWNCSFALSKFCIISSFDRSFLWGVDFVSNGFLGTSLLFILEKSWSMIALSLTHSFIKMLFSVSNSRNFVFRMSRLMLSNSSSLTLTSSFKSWICLLKAIVGLVWYDIFSSLMFSFWNNLLLCFVKTEKEDEGTWGNVLSLSSLFIVRFLLITLITFFFIYLQLILYKLKNYLFL